MLGGQLASGKSDHKQAGNYDNDRPDAHLLRLSKKRARRCQALSLMQIPKPYLPQAGLVEVVSLAGAPCTPAPGVPGAQFGFEPDAELPETPPEPIVPELPIAPPVVLPVVVLSAGAPVVACVSVFGADVPGEIVAAPDPPPWLELPLWANADVAIPIESAVTARILKDMCSSPFVCKTLHPPNKPDSTSFQGTVTEAEGFAAGQEEDACPSHREGLASASLSF